MYVITLKGVPAILPMIDALEGGTRSYSTDERRTIMCARTKSEVISLYVYNFGDTWRHRHKGVECSKAELTQGGVHLLLVICTVKGLTKAAYKVRDGNDAITAFYKAAEASDLVFAALYGTDGHMINNIYRSGQVKPKMGAGR